MAFFDAHERRLRREQKERAWLAWHSGLLSHEFKTFPPLDQLMGKDDGAAAATARQPWQEQFSVLRAWVADNTANSDSPAKHPGRRSRHG